LKSYVELIQKNKLVEEVVIPISDELENSSNLKIPDDIPGND
jgi:hypothetical protein